VRLTRHRTPTARRLAGTRRVHFRTGGRSRARAASSDHRRGLPIQLPATESTCKQRLYLAGARTMATTSFAREGVRRQPDSVSSPSEGSDTRSRLPPERGEALMPRPPRRSALVAVVTAAKTRAGAPEDVHSPASAGRRTVSLRPCSIKQAIGSRRSHSERRRHRARPPPGLRSKTAWSSTSATAERAVVRLRRRPCRGPSPSGTRSCATRRGGRHVGGLRGSLGRRDRR
jgi:hypothetical protein